MNKELEYFIDYYKLDVNQKRMPIQVLKTNREIMATLMGELNYKVGAEVGVAKGQHAELLCQKIPNLHLYCIDIWEPYEGFNEYQDTTERNYRWARRRLSKYDVSFIKAFSMDAVKQFEDNSLDFVYIDGAHDFKSVADDICEWTKKVRVGGMVYGHDYDRAYEKYVRQVKDVVQAYMYSHMITPWFALGEEGRRNGTPFREGTQSWCFIRQDSDFLRI